MVKSKFKCNNCGCIVFSTQKPNRCTCKGSYEIYLEKDKHKIRDVLIIDIETDSLDVDKAKLKWFGAYSYIDDKYYMLAYNQVKEIKSLLVRHRALVSFNGKEYDQPILERHKYNLDYKVLIDLYQMSAQKGNGDFGRGNKNKLIQMGIDIDKFSLKNIISVLKLDDVNKGEIDYKIFQKDAWTLEEIKEIKKYLKQDLVLTKKLFEWYEEQFEPLKKFLSDKGQKNYHHLTRSLSSVAYEIICNKAGLKLEWGEKIPGAKSFSGGHHINPRWNKVTGNIVNIDFTSAYPHALMMGNLYSPKVGGWNGKPYFKIEGEYDNKKFGRIESALKDIFTERLKAKRRGDKQKSQAYKIVINSLYGLTGSPIFKSLYNTTTASDCTHIVRTWLKKLAKMIEESGFIVLYGFTDNLIVKIPEGFDEERLMIIVNDFINIIKQNMTFPLDTFGMEVEIRIKFIWFAAKNCYLYVTDKDEIDYMATILNKNTPDVIMQVFNEYMKPKIIKELDVAFTQEELILKINERLEKDLQLACEEHKVINKSEYKNETSQQYQISDKYGEGIHYLIPNTGDVGIGRSKSTKKRKATRYCTIQEFKTNKLTIDDIDLRKLVAHLKIFTKKEGTV